jgi:predicted ABC-type ATPase
MIDPTPSVIVLGGPNGAGKTTASRKILAGRLGVLTFVNADVIAQGLSGFAPDAAAVAASRIMLTELHALAERQADFAFETTLAGRTTAEWLRKLRQKGYTVYLMYFWLASADLAVQRVALRVSTGGHAVPEQTIRRRYAESLRNLFRLYMPAVSAWQVFDNTQNTDPHLVAYGGADNERILDATVWAQIQREGLS